MQLVTIFCEAKYIMEGCPSGFPPLRHWRVRLSSSGEKELIYQNLIMWHIYVLKSLRNGKIYIGCTDNIKQRYKEHNSGKVKSTKAYVPYKLIFSREFSNKTLALKREHFLKTGKGRFFINTL